MTTATIERPSLAVAAEVRAEIARQGLTHAELAKRLGRNGAWLSVRIGRSADVDMTLEEIVGMAEALGVSPQRLVMYAITDSNREPADYTETVNGSLTLASVARDAWVLAA